MPPIAAKASNAEPPRWKAFDHRERRHCQAMTIAVGNASNVTRILPKNALLSSGANVENIKESTQKYSSDRNGQTIWRESAVPRVTRKNAVRMNARTIGTYTTASHAFTTKAAAMARPSSSTSGWHRRHQVPGVATR